MRVSQELNLSSEPEESSPSSDEEAVLLNTFSPHSTRMDRKKGDSNNELSTSSSGSQSETETSTKENTTGQNESVQKCWNQETQTQKTLRKPRDKAEVKVFTETSEGHAQANTPQADTSKGSRQNIHKQDKSHIFRSSTRKTKSVHRGNITQLGWEAVCVLGDCLVMRCRKINNGRKWSWSPLSEWVKYRKWLATMHESYVADVKTNNIQLLMKNTSKINAKNIY